MGSADIPAVRAWMMADPAAPRWNDVDLASAVAPATPGARLRQGWIAVHEAKAAGFAVATAVHVPPDAAECELEFLLVLPHLRRLGVGAALLETVLAWAQQQGAQHLLLEVRASNVAAQRLYASLGFEPAGMRPRYYSDPADDAIQMRRQISAAG